jgi:hypothetical protein
VVQDVDSKTLKLMRALLAKARGTENEAEAAIFMARVAKMLQDHNLQEADIGGEDATEPMIQRTVSSVDWNPWRIEIADALANLYFGKIYITRELYKDKLRRAVVLVGRPHNLDIAESMIEYLTKTTLRLAKEYSRDRKEVLQFEKGCGMRLAQRVWALARASQQPAPQVTYQPGQTTLPALYKTELELATSIVDGICGGAVARASGHRGRGSAIAAGARAGDTVSLGGQIGGKAGQRMLT